MNGKIITCHYAYNYGAVLQAYALSSFLNDNGMKTEIINYRPYYYRGSTKSTNSIKRLLRKIIRIPDNIKSEKVFYGFVKNYLPVTKEYTTYKQLANAAISADIFIAGSDQIWNFKLPNGTDLAYYLDFVSNGAKKVSYAASLSNGSLSENEKQFLKVHLNDFDKISVREQTGKKLLESSGLSDIETVMDPVYLLRSEKWEKMAKCPKKKPEGKYILVYAFNRQKYIFEAAKQLAKDYSYKIYSINTFWEDILQNTDYYYWNCKPEEFLYLIKYAECVVTNSFHGLSFSLIFNKPIQLFEKDDTGNSRMLDLLTLLGIGDMVLAKKGDKLVINNIPYKEINEKIKVQRTKSQKFIFENIIQ